MLNTGRKWCQGTFGFKGSNMLHFPLCAISQGLSVPYQFLENRNEQSCTQFSGLRSWERAPAWIPFSDSLQWLFSVAFYLKDYPFCCNWWNFILCNGWVIILLKIHKHAVLLIKYPCSTRDLGPRVLLSVFILFGAWKSAKLTLLSGLSRLPWEDSLCLREWYKSCA